VEHKATTILFANDTSILIASPNAIQLQNDINVAFEQLNKSFEANYFPLILTKTILFRNMYKIW
jgi:hypothetical protein